MFELKEIRFSVNNFVENIVEVSKFFFLLISIIFLKNLIELFVIS